MRVRFLTTDNEGDVQDTTYLPTERVGDLAGTWYYVYWDEGCSPTWVHADSVEVIHHDPRDLSFSGPEEAYDNAS